MKKIALKNAARGTVFDYAGQSWILLISTHAPLRGATSCIVFPHHFVTKVEIFIQVEVKV